MRPSACVASAALLALTLASCGGGGAASAGPVPTIPSAAKRVGFIGLPPTGAKPSTPRQGKLVARLWGPVPGDWGRSRFWVFADGRLISLREADIPEGAGNRVTGFLEQRITPEGVEIVRSAIVGSPPHWLARDVISELPNRAWADRTITAYVPSRYAVCLGWSARENKRLWSRVPARAKALLHGNDMHAARLTEPTERCWDVTTGKARALAVALDDAHFERDQSDKSYRLSYVPKRWDPDRDPVRISFEPILPNGEWACSPCG